MSEDDKNIIETKGLTVGYGDRVVLHDINFTVRQGEVFAILGRSGCGKSTLLKHMIGLYPPIAGEVWLEGKNLAEAQGEERRNLLRSFGVLYQGGALFGSMTVRENVRLPLDQFTDLPEQGKEMVVLSKLGLVGLAPAAQLLPARLSGGMQKRAALARAMALDPRILFLDEPSVGLDPVTAASLDALILELARDFGITFVVVTHDLPSIDKIASRVLMLDGESKTMIACGPPAELREHSPDPRVRAFFRREPEAETTQTQLT